MKFLKEKLKSNIKQNKFNKNFYEEIIKEKRKYKIEYDIDDYSYNYLINIPLHNIKPPNYSKIKIKYFLSFNNILQKFLFYRFFIFNFYFHL